MPPVVEMRIYTVKPGQARRIPGDFRNRSVPAHEKIGMKILGPFPAIDDPDAFFFIRAFPDLACLADHGWSCAGSPPPPRKS